MIKIVFNKKITGYENEIEFCRELNNKKVFSLNPLLREFIFDMFEKVNENDIIKCSVDKDNKKYDISISINGIMKYISIKKGIKNSVHVEGVSSFIHFLIENKVSRQNIINYLKYHYADGTTNGTGKERMDVETYKKNHQFEIDEINKAIKHEDVLIKAINRFIIKGNISENEIDALVFGVVNDFIWIKKEDIIRIILSKKDIQSSAVHFGPLTVQPLNRCLNRNPKYEKARFCVQIKWYNLSDDILENMNNNIMLKSGYKDELDSLNIVYESKI